MINKALLLSVESGVYAFALIPKCGQHTLRRYTDSFVDLGAIHNVGTRIAFIRHPLDRLKSTFHFFKQNNLYRMCDFMGSYESFIDWALSAVEEHVVPQSQFLHGCFNTLIKLECMSDVMIEITGFSIPPQNTSDHNTICDESYRIDDIKTRYKEDYILYSRALNGLY